MKGIPKIDYEFEKILFKRLDNLYTYNLFIFSYYKIRQSVNTNWGIAIIIKYNYIHL